MRKEVFFYISTLWLLFLVGSYLFPPEKKEEPFRNEARGLLDAPSNLMYFKYAEPVSEEVLRLTGEGEVILRGEKVGEDRRLKKILETQHATGGMVFYGERTYP